MRKLPDFLVIGVQKGGTRFLYHCLSQHPGITLPFDKEVHFFDRDFKKGINWYKAFFPLKLFSKSKIAGEITPRYIMNPDAPERSHTVLPNARIIVLLRDPIERAHSHFQMTRRVYELEMDFQEFVHKAINQDLGQIEKKEIRNQLYNAIPKMALDLKFV